MYRAEYVTRCDVYILEMWNHIMYPLCECECVCVYMRACACQ
jgi:hypothetical protein